MASVEWQVSGEFMGNCSCDHLRCPCPTSNYTELPNRGWCKICIAFHVDKGRFGDVKLDGLNAVVVIHSPAAMADGNWAIGMILDDRASPEQQQALAGILSGQAGGPMTMAGPWVGNFLGIEVKPIKFERKGNNFSVEVPGMIDLASEPTAGANRDEPVYLDNVWHPANTRVALSKGIRNHTHAFGIDYDAVDPNFSAYAPFDWKSD